MIFNFDGIIEFDLKKDSKSYKIDNKEYGMNVVVNTDIEAIQHMYNWFQDKKMNIELAAFNKKLSKYKV